MSCKEIANWIKSFHFSLTPGYLDYGYKPRRALSPLQYDDADDLTDDEDIDEEYEDEELRAMEEGMADEQLIGCAPSRNKNTP